MDRRKIDPSSKDYIVTNDSYESMNAISQRVYIALSRLRLTETRKKTSNLALSEVAKIESALEHLIKAKQISNVKVSVDTFSAAGMSIVIQYTNLTLGRNESYIG